MKIFPTLLNILILLLDTLFLIHFSKAFKVTKIEGSPIEKSRVNDIKTISSDSLLKCIEECKSLDAVSIYPSCSAVQYDDAQKSCILSYVHRSSTPIGWNPIANDPNTETKTVFTVPGSELSSKYNSGS